MPKERSYPRRRAESGLICSRLVERSDAELLAAWRAGDPKAGSRLVDRHFRAVYGFFRNKLGGEVEDLVQRTFLAVVKSRDVYRGDASFRTYLFAIARNELLQHFRQRGSAHVVEDLGAMPSEHLDPDPDPGASTILHARGEHRLLLRALRRVPLDDQIALELVYFEELGTPEVARVLGVPEPTLRGRLQRARARLHEQIEALRAEGEALRDTTVPLDDWIAGLRDVVRADLRARRGRTT
jgi:RNA polymerase sigma factor (sigma-70 family)